MKYSGRYKIFDPTRIQTYPLSTRTNKVKLHNLVSIKNVEQLEFDLPDKTLKDIAFLAKSIVSYRKKEKPVVLFSGAHLIKNGLGPLLVDLVRRKMITLVAGNGATAIHDFELALIGETSEHVPDAVGKGQFGMAYEFTYINTALEIGNKERLGYGESLGKMICETDFRDKVLARTARGDSPDTFSHPEVSVLATCYQSGVPFTVHAGVGVDVIDQHPSFNGEAKGGCSGRDFLIYTNEITKFTRDGILLNVGSAVQGPEVFLKAVSMAANVGKKPRSIIAADFDLRNYDPGQLTDESSPGYYFRDQKSVVSRIPGAFGGQGFYIQGNQIQTFPCLYQEILKCLK